MTIPVRSEGAAAAVHRSGGFTLIEALLVVALLGMIAATSVGLLGGASTRARRAAAVAAVSRVDALARTAARSEGTAVRIAPTEDASEFEVRSVRIVADGTAVPPHALPEGWRVSLVAERGIDHVVVDAAGRSRDFAYELRSGEDRVVVDVAGRTGQLVVRTDGVEEGDR